MANTSGSLTAVSTVKLALMAKQARAQLGAIARAEPIAIIGMGCRFPGGADSPEAYWSLLRHGVDAVSEMPRDRWDVDALYDPDPAAPGKMSASHGGFLDRVDTFDAAFFGILRREAERMDPQHRVFLEVAVDALDRAGLSRERLAGSSTGVFIASYYNDYALLQFADRDGIDARTLTGTQHSVLANRLSYLLDLRGPSLSIDTACSSSLVAVHLACQSLRADESEIALAGGVSLILAPDTMIALSKVGFMSASGRCRTFDAGADGFIPGEGCGVVVLKRLSDAIADNDRVLAVIRGSAVNQDGRSTVLAAPNGLAQQALVREALAHAQLTPDRVGFVEAHGTATPLGDPIEVEALAATIGARRADGSICYLGSAKANLGHLEAAAGVAGLIKATLVLQHGEIPGQVHFTTLNPHLSLAGTCLAVAGQHRVWPPGALPRVAGVSGFGVGGTNAHVLVEEAPVLPAPAADAVDGEPQLLALSAQSAAALRMLASAWVAFLPRTTESAARLAATAGGRRSHYDHRLALVGGSKAQFEAQLRGFVDGDAAPTVAAGRRPRAGTPRIAFVFSGQGPQWVQMGRELAAREPVFRNTLADLDDRFQRLAGWSISSVLASAAESSRLQDTEIAQPAIFALQVALSALWDAWGVRPDAVVGHSVGELAALHVAGVLSLDDAMRVVWHRGRIMQHATGLGRMAAAALTAAEAESLVGEIGPDLSLAAINGPHSVVLSGAPEAIAGALAALDARGVSHQALPVPYAFHSAQMQPFQAELVATIGSVRARPGRLAVYSTVTGAMIEHTQIDAAYFGRNLRQAVRFATAIDAMLDTCVDAFVEIAPHPVLGASIVECLARREQMVPVLASLRRGRPERETMLRACAGVYAVGRSPRWEAVTEASAVPVDLPAYPWQRERFWLRDVPAAKMSLHAERAGTAHSLLGECRSRDVNGTDTYETRWPSDDLAWLADHKVGGHTLLPAAALLETLRAAAQARHGTRAWSLVDFVVQQPLLPDETAGWTTVISQDGEQARLEIWACTQAEAIDRTSARQIASARTAARRASGAVDVAEVPLGEWQDQTDALYRGFADLGVCFGPRFRTLERWRVGNGAGEGWLARTPHADSDGTADGVHPILLDGALQLCLLAASSTSGAAPVTLVLPIAVESYTLHRRSPVRLRAKVTISHRGAGGSMAASVRLLAEDDSLVASLDGVRFAPAGAAALAALATNAVGLYQVRWQQVSESTPVAASQNAHGAWVVLADGNATATALIAALTAAGGRCLRVRTGSATRRDGPGAWTIVRSNADAMRACLSDSAWRGGLPLRGIVHTWSLDAAGERAADDLADWLTTGSALELVQTIGQASLPGVPLWLVTRGAQPAATGTVAHPRQAGMWGLASVVAVEYPDLPCHVVDLDSGSTPGDAAALVGELLQPRVAGSRLALRGTSRYTPRLERYVTPGRDAPRVDGPSAIRLVVAKPGTLDGLVWQATTAAPPREGEVRLSVVAAGVNFRDVLLALGMYPGEGATLGAECAGIVEAVGDDVSALQVGDVVFGFAPGSIGTDVTVPARFLARVPATVRVEDAAALPVAFLTAMYGLQHVAEIERGARVLIHAGAGGVGLAAIQLAQRRGAHVYATAGSEAKRELLRSLGVEQVFDSRSLAFADQVLLATGGAGVDVVLNSLAGEFIPASLRVLASGGWFLELGKRDIWAPERMASTRPDVRYRAYDLGAEAHADPSLAGRLLGELCAGLADGSLRPLPVRTFTFHQASAAFRFMAQARHLGKLVLRAPRATSRDGARRALAHGDATYWITGGAGALGVRTARWLVESGARHIVLTGRAAPSPDAQRIIDALVARGAHVHFRVAEAGDEAAMTAVRDEIVETMPALRGVVHAAGVADDGMLVHQTWARWRAALQGKARGARVLDAITRDVTLDFFVLYSSAGLLLAPIGQGSYAAANAELDAIAWARRSSGFPALSVAWGQWREAGMAARLVAQGHDPWSARGLGWLATRDAFTQLERLLRDDATYAAVLPIDWNRFLSQLPAGTDDAFFHAVAPERHYARRSSEMTPNGDVSLVVNWRAAPSGQRHGLVLAHLADRTRYILGLDDQIVLDNRVPLKDVGLDSLMAVELRNLLSRSLGTSLPATLLFDYPSLDALSSYLARVLNLTPGTAPVGGAAPMSELVDAVAGLTDAEAEAMLVAELDGGSGPRNR